MSCETPCYGATCVVEAPETQAAREALAVAKAKLDQHGDTIRQLLLAGVKIPRAAWLPLAQQLSSEWLHAHAAATAYTPNASL